MTNEFDLFLFRVGNCTSIIQNIVLIVCGGLTAWAACAGLNSWKRQRQGEENHKLAKKTLKAVYGVRLGFQQVRNPYVFSYEYPEHMRDPGGNLLKEYKFQGTEYVYNARMLVLSKAFRKLQEIAIEAEVAWENFEKEMEPIRKCYARLHWAVRVHLDEVRAFYPKPGELSEDPGYSVEDKKEASLIRIESRKDNKFTVDVNAAVKSLEDFLRKKFLIQESRR